MTGVRKLIVVACAVGLLAAGALGFAVTRAAWEPCAGDQLLEPCLRAMDQPGHLAALQVLWLLCVGLCVVALFASSGGRARTFAVVALILVVVMNAVTEYVLWLGLAGGHWDVPPGTGYTQAAAFAVAGVLLAAGALLRRPDVRLRPQVAKPGIHAMQR